eukprot:m.353740 g.353740  ORF g.353740 m.353740 type:complete len:392 (+) comp27996_c0_seq4:1687-2862(+)
MTSFFDRHHNATSSNCTIFHIQTAGRELVGTLTVMVLASAFVAMLAMGGRDATTHTGIADVNSVSVSGISSGADMAAQLQVVLSRTFMGVGIFAGQAYHCAVYRFPLDPLKAPNPSVPYCDGCPKGETLTYDHCKNLPNITSAPPLVARATAAAAAGEIDDLATLRTRRAFLYRGKSDTTYNKGSVNATANVFRALMPPESVHFEDRIDSPHLVPGINPYLCWWEEWSGPDNCTYDGARHALEWIYGRDALSRGRDNATESLFPLLKPFDQRPHLPNSPPSYLADKGRIFVPPACEPAGSKCKLHVFLHGCGVSFSYDVFTKYSGFNEWAMRNNIIILYPKMGTSGPTSQLKSGCFDGYGQTSDAYDQRTAPQIIAIKSMVDSLTGAQVNV